MKALHFDGQLAVREVPDPVAAPDEALVRVELAGICATDLEVVRGYMGYRGVLGHEFVGRVEAADDRDWVDRRVVGEISLSCGQCVSCQTGLWRHCPSRRVLGIQGKDGCFARWVTLPLRNLHRLPDEVPDEVAVFAEPLAAAFELLEQVALQRDGEVLVLGDGRLGLLVCMVLVRQGCRVTLVGRHEQKMALVRPLGVQGISPEALGERRFPLTVEATGSPEGLAQAIRCTAPRGTLVLKSTYHGRPQIDAARLVIDEISLVGSRCGPFEPAIEALASRGIDPRPLIEARYPLAEGIAAMRHAGRPGALKVLLVPG